MAATMRHIVEVPVTLTFEVELEEDLDNPESLSPDKARDIAEMRAELLMETMRLIHTLIGETSTTEVGVGQIVEAWETI